MNTAIKVAINVTVVALKVASTYLIAKKLIEAGDERWGRAEKQPQQ